MRRDRDRIGQHLDDRHSDGDLRAIEIICSGSDEQEAMAKLKVLFADGFGFD